MADAIRDQNHVTSKLAVLNTDLVQGTHLVNIGINTATGGIKIDQVSTISFTMSPIDPHDNNWQKCWLFEGSDGLTYPAVANSDGEILIDIL